VTSRAGVNDALVLAAGYGSRLSDIAPSKPLAQVHGVPLIEIAIRQLAGVGVQRVAVATGYRADEVEAALPAIARRAGVTVEARRVPDFRKPNGHSVIAGSAGFDGRYVLVMADHILSHELLSALVARAPVDADATLAIDRRVGSPLVDPEDATWVRLGEGTAIARIGKGLAKYDAVDCGAFVAGPALSRAIAAALGNGQPGSLSDGMQRLADTGRAQTVDIGEAWWIDVDDAKALRQAEAQVRQYLPQVFDPQGARV